MRIASLEFGYTALHCTARQCFCRLLALGHVACLLVRFGGAQCWVVAW